MRRTCDLIICYRHQAGAAKVVLLPRYFFDINDGEYSHDDEGTECADFEEDREKIITSLPEMAGWIDPNKGDNQSVIVNIRNENGVAIYTATLSFVGNKIT